MPFEGPAALEALANGCFFINPKVYQRIIIMSTACFFYIPITTLLPPCAIFFVLTYMALGMSTRQAAMKKVHRKKNYISSYFS